MEKEQQQIIQLNIERLLKQKNIKRSQAEKDLGLSAGYFSRKQKHTSKIDVCFLSKISKYLNVSLDYLMINPADNTTDKQALTDFFESIYMLSVNDSLFWKSHPLLQAEDNQCLGPVAETIESVREDYEEIYPPHITDFLAKHLYPDDRGFWGYTWTGCLSLKSGKKIDQILYTRETVIDDFFYAKIENIDSTLYLYRVDYANENETHKISDIIEAYLQNGKEKYYLCNSLEWGDYLSSKLRELFQIAKDKCDSNRLDEGARKLLRLFNTSNKQ